MVPEGTTTDDRLPEGTTTDHRPPERTTTTHKLSEVTSLCVSRQARLPVRMWMSGS